MSGTTLILVVVNKKTWCSARFINTELIVKLLINRGVRKVQYVYIRDMGKNCKASCTSQKISEHKYVTYNGQLCPVIAKGQRAPNAQLTVN